MISNAVIMSRTLQRVAGKQAITVVVEMKIIYFFLLQQLRKLLKSCGFCNDVSTGGFDLC